MAYEYIGNIEFSYMFEYLILGAAITVFVTAIMAVLTQSRAGVFFGLAYCIFMLTIAFYILQTYVMS